jgi:hypothetical protein
MAIPFYISQEFTSTATGAVLKFAQCEKCQTTFAYKLVRRVVGRGSSLYFLDNTGAAERARKKAESGLRDVLAKGFDAVPCPECGWFQAYMVPKFRREAFRWMYVAGMLALIGFIVFLTASMIVFAAAKGAPDGQILGTVFLAAAAVSFAAGTGLLAGKAVRSRMFDPNATDAEDRKRLGKSRSVWGVDLEQILNETGPPSTETTSKTRSRLGIG